MNRKRVLALLLSSVLAVSAFAGCGKKEKAVEQDLSTADLKGEENEWGWVVPEETLVLDVFGGEGDQEDLEKDENGGKAKLDKWLLDSSGRRRMRTITRLRSVSLMSPYTPRMWRWTRRA